MRRNVRQIRVTSVEHIWPRLSKHDLHSFRRRIHPRESDTQPHPARIPLPNLSPPGICAKCTFSCRTRDNEQAKKRNGGRWDDKAGYHKLSYGDSLLDGERVGYALIG